MGFLVMTICIVLGYKEQEGGGGGRGRKEGEENGIGARQGKRGFVLIVFADGWL